ncbi:hypothetical protein SBY92_001770 [Candida maltosa Xu316]
MSSRLRKLDKTILSQTSELIDIDDQTDLIDTLTSENLQTYKTYVRYLTILYLIQIGVLFILPKSVHYELFTISILLNIINTNYRKYYKVLMVVNGFISLQLTYIGYVEQGEYWFIVLPWFNYLTPLVFLYWFKNMNESVLELEKLKYEYKNV